MPVGKQDWSYAVDNVVNEQVSDYAELAARLGSVYTHYRTGNLVWYTGFENNDASFRTVTVSGGTIADFTTITQHGATAKQITVTSAAAGEAGIYRYEPFINFNGIGFSYSIKADTDNGYHDTTIELIIDGTVYLFIIRYTPSSNEWSVQEPSGFTVFATHKINDRQPDGYYDRVKLVVDGNSKRYIHFIINGVFYDLTAYSVVSAPSTYSDQAVFYINGKIPASGNNVFCLDSLIVTQNEPLN